LHMSSACHQPFAISMYDGAGEEEKRAVLNPTG